MNIDQVEYEKNRKHGNTWSKYQGHYFIGHSPKGITFTVYLVPILQDISCFVAYDLKGPFGDKESQGHFFAS